MTEQANSTITNTKEREPELVARLRLGLPSEHHRNNNMNLLSQAPDLVSRGVKQGLLSYPLNTQFSPEGKPQPKMHVVRYKKTPLEQYACLRAYEMSLRGIPKKDIATSIRCPMARIDQVLAHGREVHKRRKESKA